MVGAASWVLTVVFLVGQIVAQSAWKGPPGYSVLNDAISDLGVTVCGTVSIAGIQGYYCSPLHEVMNASFILTGAFILLGAYLTRDAWPHDGKVRSGLVLIALTGIGKVASGLNPANVNFTLHSLGALGIPVGDLGLVLVGLGFRGKVGWMFALDVPLGAAGLLGFAYFLAGKSLTGLSERVGSYPIIIWCVVMGYCFLRWRREAEGS